MRLTILTLCSLMIGLSSARAISQSSSPVQWHTDYAAAHQLATQTGKPLLLDFTGSDWCYWCHRIDKEIFDQPFFTTFAQENLILVKVDFPRKTPQSSRLKIQNRHLDERFDVTGYPTIILISPEGQELGRTGYMRGGPKTFVRELKRFIAKAPNEPK